jgi:hypothetical protein
MISIVEAEIAEAVVETGDREFISKLGLFLESHPGLIGRAAITAMREPTDLMGLGLPADYRPGSHSATAIWRYMVDAALAP